jgi:methylmalonyl-CoA mutase, C-terminal domain
MKRIRVLVAKPGLDGHDRGAKVIAAALRDAGMEVIYTGLRANVVTIAAAAEQEDVDVIGLSILSGAHQSICQKLFAELERRGLEIPVVVGGVIPTADFPKLKAIGVAAVFGPESPIDAVTQTVRQIAEATSNPQPLVAGEGTGVSP